jgi:cobalt-zinc-cadmium efflux system membrane fusion protein
MTHAFIAVVLTISVVTTGSFVLAVAQPAATPVPTRDPNRLWCEEHGVYEDECALCHPELAAKSGQAHSELFCDEHRVPESECGICHPELISNVSLGQGLKVRLASAQSAAKAGVEIARPEVGPVAAAVECYAEIVFDQNRLAHVVAPVSGAVRSVAVDLGSRVKEGAPLATLWSAAIAEAQSTYLRVGADAALRKQTLERERRLRAAQVSSQRELQEAEAAYRAAEAAMLQARQHLETLGFRGEEIDALKSRPGSAVLQVRAPFAGEIIQRGAVTGALVDAGSTLFSIADSSVVWAMLKIPDDALARVKVGQSVELTIEALADETFAGVITWIAPQLDERTRLGTARAEVPNPDGRLKARMFARARTLTGSENEAFLVPASALQQLDGEPWLFVKLEDDLYEARPVRLGAQQDGRVEIAAGLRSEDQVVVARSFVLKSELLKSRLGAGCVDE